MKLEQFSAEELKHLSMIELAHAILSSKQAPVAFEEMREEIAITLGLSKEELLAKLSQFYTDLNIDGRFICLGDNRWGLRTWYPYEQIDEEVLPQTKVKPKKKRAKKYDEDVLEDDTEDGFDDVDEVELLDEDDFDDEEEADELLEDDLLDEDDFELDEDLLEDEEELDENEDEDEEEEL